MRRSYVLAPSAALDLIQIWRHLKYNASTEIANRVEATIRDKIAYLAGRPGSGHWRKDLTSEQVKFFPIYSYLIVYRPETNPLQIVAILHGRRDLEELLKDRL
jgi:plasmid stabilization system protein ParE